VGESFEKRKNGLSGGEIGGGLEEKLHGGEDPKKKLRKGGDWKKGPEKASVAEEGSKKRDRIYCSGVIRGVGERGRGGISPDAGSRGDIEKNRSQRRRD